MAGESKDVYIVYIATCWFGSASALIWTEMPLEEGQSSHMPKMIHHDWREERGKQKNILKPFVLFYVTVVFIN